jgi:hypothetical protein
MPHASRQKILDPLPLIVSQTIATHLSAPQLPTSYESRKN